MKKIKSIVFACGLAFLSLPVVAQQKSYIETLNTPVKWVDSVFKRLSKREKIAQMFFVRAHTNLSKAYQDSVGKVIRRERLGGVVFFQGGPGRQVILSNKYQDVARVPLLIASDGEWGLGMRLDSTIAFPYQMTLGAIQDEKLIYEMGLEVARQYRRIGMHMNLAPDVDVNNNAKNPVINFRSFGENKFNVAKKGAAYMKGMQDGGLLISLKHFPGHGDTDVDSHYDLPQLNFTKARLDSLEMYPFKQLINQGAAGVMIAHMNIPALDNTPNMPSTLSRPIVTDLLKNQLGFKGLVISDAMGMKGVVKFFKDGEADVMGVVAGNDILELSENSARGIKLVRRAIRKDRISMKQIDESVRKILTAKYWAGLNRYSPTIESGVSADLNTSAGESLLKKLSDASVTVLRGKNYIRTLEPQKRTILLSIGEPNKTKFQEELSTYFPNSAILNISRSANANDIAKILVQITANDQLVVAVHDNRSRPGNNIPLSSDVFQCIKDLSKRNAVFALFANPYNLEKLEGLQNSSALIVGYQNEGFMQKSVADVVKNQLNATGKLPVSVGSNYKYGDGL